MDRMFDGCSSLESLDLSGFDISMVKKANLMFHGCSSLRCVILNKMTLADPSIAVIGGDDIQEENEQKQTVQLHNWIQ
ncbi:MAG: hypothetical protein HUJ54_10975 [Erysipelotrichaceae bacterium]|nr:hypothetical protein [Erysipelotrichaceae bacterium]